MMNRFSLLLLCVPAVALFAACSSSKTDPVVAASDGGGPDAGGIPDATGGGTMCTKARDDLLIPIDKVATGTVKVVSDTGGTKTLFVDAAAGGFGQSIKNPRVYVNLESGTKISVTDKTAPMSTDWDLAMRRSFIWTNSGDAGIGTGGAIQLNKPFASVSAADVSASTLEKERFFDADCKAVMDQAGMAPSTTFSDWYDYDVSTMMITGPKDVTYVVRGGTGKMYKLAITSYEGGADGTTGKPSGGFLMKVTAL